MNQLTETWLNRFRKNFVRDDGLMIKYAFDSQGNDITTGEAVESFIQAELNKQKREIVEMIEGMKPPVEDDEEVYLYRHCADGDHWKCGGDGESGKCVCRCHVIDDIIKKVGEV